MDLINHLNLSNLALLDRVIKMQINEGRSKLRYIRPEFVKVQSDFIGTLTSLRNTRRKVKFISNYYN